MISPRSRLIKFIEQGAITPQNIEEALKATGTTPDPKAWRTFIDHLLLWLGGLALGFSVLFFIAYNWNAIGRFAKFAIVEGVIVLSVAAYCRFAADSAASRVSLLVAAISLGVLMALYGQTYQTGADPWQLFFNWAILMLPWAIIGRFSALWILWAGLINTSIVLYYRSFSWRPLLVFDSETEVLWLTFILNTLFLAAWEFSTRFWHWLSERWAIRLLAASSGVPITWLLMDTIFDFDRNVPTPGIIWAGWLVAMYFVYRRVKPDLFMLALCCLSVITVSVSFLSKHVLDSSDAGGYLLIALLVIGMGAGAAIWLKNIHRELQS